MPYRFRFKVGHHLLFHCEVASRQCHGHSKNGARCRRRVIIGFEYCFQHLKSERHLTIRPSTLIGALCGMKTSPRDYQHKVAERFLSL